MSAAQWSFPTAALCLSLSFSVPPLYAAQLLSLDQTGTGSGNFGISEFITISADGRFATFESRATNHVAGDTNASLDVFVHDCVLKRHVWNTTHALSFPTPGALQGSRPWALTPSGRYLAFDSTATNLVPGLNFNPNTGFQLYVQDLLSNVTTLVSVAHDGTNLANPGLGFRPRSRPISSDGRFVAFAANATNLTSLSDANDRGFDIFCRDLANSTTEVITVAPGGGSTLDASTSSFIMSTNGRFFAFETMANYVIAGISNTSRTVQVYWRDRTAETTALVTVTVEGGYAFSSGNSLLRDMSADGRYVCFQSLATNLIAGQNDSHATYDLFIRDMFLGETWLVTRNTNGAASGSTQGGQFSADSSVLIFSSSIANLVPNISDANGSSLDIFAHYLSTRTNAIVSVSSQGNTGADRFTADSFARISATGKYVLFTSTATNLITAPPAAQRLYLRDLHAGRTLDALRSFFPTPAFNEARMAISDDERHIFFLTQTNFDHTVVDTNNGVDLFRSPLYEPKFLTARPMVADALPNTTYVLQSSIDLANWFNTFTNVSDGNGQLIYNLHSTSPIHFHRLLWR